MNSPLSRAAKLRVTRPLNDGRKGTEKCFDSQILNRHNFEEGSSSLALHLNKSRSEEAKARMVSMMDI